MSTSKLIQKITKQLNKEEIRHIVDTFIDTLIENDPSLDEYKLDKKQIAEYLVNRQPEGDVRLKAVSDFFCDYGKII